MKLDIKIISLVIFFFFWGGGKKGGEGSIIFMSLQLCLFSAFVFFYNLAIFLLLLQFNNLKLVEKEKDDLEEPKNKAVEYLRLENQMIISENSLLHCKRYSLFHLLLFSFILFIIILNSVITLHYFTLKADFKIFYLKR